jgi:hypothetical protein
MKKIAYLAFTFLGPIWGSNFIFVKWAAEEITPGQIVLLRVSSVGAGVPICPLASSTVLDGFGTLRLSGRA